MRTIEVVVALTKEVREQIKARGLAEVNKIRAVLGKPPLKELLKGVPHSATSSTIASSIISGTIGMRIGCETRLIRDDGKEITGDEGRHVLEFCYGDTLTCAKKVAEALGTETIVRLGGEVYVAMSPDLCILADIFNAQLIPELME